MAVSLRRYLFKIPSRHGGTVVKYLGFIPLNPLEIATDLAKPKYRPLPQKVVDIALKRWALPVYTASKIPVKRENYVAFNY